MFDDGMSTLWAREDHPPEPTPPLPAENGIHVWRAAVIMPFFSFIFVAGRFYSRVYILNRKLGFDDYLVGATLLACIAYSVLMANATYHGMGLHIWQFTPELNSQYYLWIGIASEFYVLSLAGFKSALLLLYLEIFGVNKKFRIACYIALFYTLGYLTSNGLTEFLGCTPVARKWDKSIPGTCINTVAANIAYGAGHMTSDLIIGILPLRMIWKLQFPTKNQKLGLSFVLSSGLIAWAVAVVRWAISTYNMLIYDRPWWAGISFTFSILEVNTGLICACVATFSPLMHVVAASVSSWSSRRSSYFTGSKGSKYDKSAWGYGSQRKASIPFVNGGRKPSYPWNSSNAPPPSDSHACCVHNQAQRKPSFPSDGSRNLSERSCCSHDHSCCSSERRLSAARVHYPSHFSTISNDSLEIPLPNINIGRISEERVDTGRSSSDFVGPSTGRPSSTNSEQPVFTPSFRSMPTFSPVSPEEEFPPYDLQGLQALAAHEKV